MFKPPQPGRDPSAPGFMTVASLLLLTSGGPGGSAPIIGTGDPADFSGPLPQALALTSIVITFGDTAFLLALGYRSWRMTRDDMVENDVEDRLIARQRDRDELVEETRLAEREQRDDEGLE